MADFATVAPMDLDLDLDSDLDDMSLDDPMDWEDFATVAPMGVDSDLDSDDMSLDDLMDWENSDIYAPMEIDDLMDAMISSMVSLLVSDPLCPSSSSFIIDKHGRLVHCSLQLAANDGSTHGSVFVASAERIYL
jgi:hypothetical protein